MGKNYYYKNKHKPEKPTANPIPAAVNTKPNKVKKPKGWWSLVTKLLILFIIALSAIIFTDKKGYFLTDQLNNHNEKRWNSFYKLTEKDTLDVIVIGTSHAYTGINPKNLSEALGCNCFVLSFSGTTIMDTYFCLQEALTQTKPKLVVIDGYGIGNETNHELVGGGLSSQCRSYYARKNIPLKLKSMPKLFTVENYGAAWSNTIRNHEILFRNQQEMKTNIELVKKEKLNKDEEKLYLGRFVRFTSGLEDSTLVKYDSLGPTVDGNKQYVCDEAALYARKIVEMCNDNGIATLFITIPMYYKHIKDYDAWKNHLRKAVPDDVPWLDLQDNYDTVMYSPACFENTIKGNQHLTYYGSLVVTYQLANYINDSMDVKLPRRCDTEHWHNMFYGEEGYFMNYSPRENDTTYKIISKDKMFGDVHVIDFVVDDDRNLLMKIDKSSMSVPVDEIKCFAKVKLNSNIVEGSVELNRNMVYRPLNHHCYSAKLVEDCEILSLNGIMDWKTNKLLKMREE